MKRRNSPSLAAIDAKAMRKAIAEFNERGRAQFLRRHRFGRSSKFYLHFGQRLYDTKALVAAAHRRATGRTLRHTQFGGGAQTRAVFGRLAKQDSDFKRVFEDRFGELSNLSTEYDRIPRNWTNLRELGFSKWISLENYADLNTRDLPGVYIIAESVGKPHGKSIIDERVVYIGETVDQTLSKRLYQFCCSIKGKDGHGGGVRLHKKPYRQENLWFAIRSFPLGYGLDDTFAKSFRSAQIRHLERMLLYEYVQAFGVYPHGNRK